MPLAAGGAEWRLCGPTASRAATPLRLFAAAAAWLLSLSAIGSVAAATTQQADELLRHADAVKTANNSEFIDILRRLDGEAGQLTPAQKTYLRYLQAWQLGYSGEYRAAAPALEAVINEAADPTMRFRAEVSLVNDQALATRYEEAYARLNDLLELQPQVSDPATRNLGYAVASLLYNEAGQYDLGLSYAEHWLADTSDPTSPCKATYLKLDALFRGGKLQPGDPQLRSAIDACTAIGESLYANLIRTFVANIEISQGRTDDALKLLLEHDAAVQSTHSARLASEFHSLIARCYLAKNDLARARQYALSAVEKSIRNETSKPLVDAYQVLYDAAKKEGNIADALSFHEKYAAADKGYLNDTTARTLAFQMVNQQVLDKKRQIDALNERNQVLQLQQEVAHRAAETERLYVTLLICGLAFIALWAYRTKRSQIRFQNLARRDGLTGIVNRQHFMDEAKLAIQYCAKSGREVALILIDLDNFKTVNDTYGHAAGDSVLRQAVTVCQVHMRSVDLFGRLGGEEFGVLLPDCSLEVAHSRAEELRAGIAAMASPGVKAPVSASFGVTSTRASGHDLRQMLLHADCALYHAKHQGRNRVESFDESLIEAVALGA